MTKKRNYRSGISAVIHETVEGMFKAGVLDKKTMREFDASCLTPIHDFSAREIRALRKREDVSQSVFAHYLGVTANSISQWERGEKRPAGPALKLLSLVETKGLNAIA